MLPNMARRPRPSTAVFDRAPAWSGLLTTRVAALVPPGWRPAALSGIKVIHTAIFASVGALIVMILWDGLRQRPGRRTLVAGGVVLGESAIFLSNNQVCPLTPLAEEIGASRGSVADIFLPDWFARRIPLVGGGAALLGLVLNGQALRRRRSTLRRTSGRSRFQPLRTPSPARFAPGACRGSRSAA